MQPIRVTASFTKKLSDGNYGHEEATAFTEALLDEGDRLEDALTALQLRLRETVHTQLEHSPNPAIRQALVPITPLRTDREIHVATGTADNPF